MKNYIGILSRLHNTPLLISSDKLKIITEAVTIPILLGKADTITRVESGSNATVREFATELSKDGRKIAVIPVFDSLVSKEISAGSGMTSYQDINNKIDLAIEQGFTDVGFYFDTPGGEPSVFGLSEKIRSLPSRGINTFGFCDMACSAGYALASAVQHLYATPVASIGSIAAVAVHMEISKQAEKEGKTYTVFRSKGQKALGDPYTALSEPAVTMFTSMLDILDTEFNNDVHKSRPSLSLDVIDKLNGKALIGKEALQAGLVDALVPNLENALSLFLKDSKLLQSPKPTGITMSEPTALETQLADLKTQLADADAQVTALTTEVASLKEAAVTEAERISTILSTAQTLKVDLATAVKYTDSKYTAEIATEILTDLAASADASISLDSSSTTATAGVDGEGIAGSAALKEGLALSTNN